MAAQSLKLDVDNAACVSALLQQPDHARACFVFAHGAGAGMSHPFMETVATGLCERGIATLRYQFPYMEKGSKRPDPPAVAHAAGGGGGQKTPRGGPRAAPVAGGENLRGP